AAHAEGAEAALAARTGRRVLLFADQGQLLRRPRDREETARQSARRHAVLGAEPADGEPAGQGEEPHRAIQQPPSTRQAAENPAAWRCAAPRCGRANSPATRPPASGRTSAATPSCWARILTVARPGSERRPPIQCSLSPRRPPARSAADSPTTTRFSAGS